MTMPSAPERPVALTPRYEAIPVELRQRPQWVCWRYEWRDDKWTKVPINARTGDYARSDDPATWCHFRTAVAVVTAETHTVDGVGYVFAADDPYTGIDFDHCRDPASGELDAWANAAVTGLHSYTEVSPSGTGVKVIVRATLPGGGTRRKRPDGIPGGAVELYDCGRYFTLTGHHQPPTPAAIHDATDTVTALYARLTAPATPPPAAAPTPAGTATSPGDGALADAAIVQRLASGKQAAAFNALWSGDLAGYPSASEGDLALCGLLAFYTGPDEAHIDRLFRQSARMRAKWDERHGDATYGAKTVRKALDGRTTFYAPFGQRAGGMTGNGGRRQHAGTVDGESTGEPAPDDADRAAEWTPLTPAWPEPLADEAYYGLIGDYVRTVEPHSEGDPVGLLVTTLACVGNCIGRSPHAIVDADRHHCNLNAITVGESSAARKGVVLNRALALMRLVDERWTEDRVLGGLSSGEGLIWAVRDPIHRYEHDKKSGQTTKVLVDPGVDDKRLLITESEFASVLRQFQRDGNTLSTVIRDAWDGKTLAALTKNSPARASGAYISIIGHITQNELLRYLDSTEAANGFGNRFLWLGVRRSKYLPDGGGAVDLTAMSETLRKRVHAAQQIGLMRRDAEAGDLWRAVYRPLEEAKPGLLGTMIARAAPTVLRLSMIYALIDGTATIGAAHLTAALAVWDYAEASARFIFGDALGDPVADEILRALRTSPDGLTRTDIYSGLFGRNQRAVAIGRALAHLIAKGLARCVREETGGRPVERWYAVRPQ